LVFSKWGFAIIGFAFIGVLVYYYNIIGIPIKREILQKLYLKYILLSSKISKGGYLSLFLNILSYKFFLRNLANILQNYKKL
jgi:hypothetical protein